MSETIVVNYRHEKYDVKIMRTRDGRIPDPPKQGCFGNPFTVAEHGRDGCIDLFRQYFYDRLEKDDEFAMAVLALKGKRLGCCCKPLACHGDIIVAWINQQKGP